MFGDLGTVRLLVRGCTGLGGGEGVPLFRELLFVRLETGEQGQVIGEVGDKKRVFVELANALKAPRYQI